MSSVDTHLLQNRSVKTINFSYSVKMFIGISSVGVKISNINNGSSTLKIITNNNSSIDVKRVTNSSNYTVNMFN